MNPHLTPASMAHRMELAAEVAELGIFVRDEDRIGGEWNAQMYRLFRLDPAQGLPSQAQWLALVHPDDRERMTRSRELILSQDAGFVEHEYRVQFSDGEVRWMSQRARRETIEGRNVLFGITADVTARVLNEQALRQAHERAALSARSVGMGVWEWDSANGISIWDDAMFRLRGMEPRPQVPDDDELLSLIHPDDRDAVAARLSAASRLLGPSACDFRVIWPDGTVRWLASRSMPLAVVDGNPTRCIGVNWDITDHIEAESAQRAKLLSDRESHAKTELLARISHELRTPLHAVLGFAQLLQHEFEDPTARPRTRIDPIVAAGQHLLALINDLLDLSNLQVSATSLRTQPVSVAEVVAEALLFVEGPARASRVTTRLESLEGVVDCDRARLRQVLINLLTNAIKYNREGGEAAVHSIVGQDHVTLVVQDNGLGVSPEQIASMFEPLNRLGREHSGVDGTGIGLTLVKVLVGHMGGQLRVSSEPGSGTRFEVDLPRSMGPAVIEPTAQAAQHVTASGTDSRRSRLLYIEDNPVNALLVQELVNSHTLLDIVIEETGTLGVARARQMRPELVLIDMQLPDFDGFEVLRQLKADPETAKLTCVALSANALPAYIARAMAAGFDDYWTKPIDFSEFLGALEQLFPNAVHLTPLQ